MNSPENNSPEMTPRQIDNAQAKVQKTISDLYERLEMHSGERLHFAASIVATFSPETQGLLKTAQGQLQELQNTLSDLLESMLGDMGEV